MKIRCTLLSLTALCFFSCLNSGYAQFTEIRSGSEFKRIKKVYERLCRTFGDKENAPLLRYYQDAEGKLSLRYFREEGNRRPPRIEISQKVFAVCSNFGDDADRALASLLAHELVHHYYGHKANRTYFAFSEEDTDRPGVEEIKKNETEADLKGIFYGFIAGYDTYAVFPRVIDAVYRTFELSDNLHGYPSRTERKEACIRAEEKLVMHMSVFKAAEAFYALGNYEEAIHFYSFLKKKYPAFEILNNLAAARLKLVLENRQLNTPKEIRFAFPIELILQSKLTVSTHGPAKLALSGSRSQLDSARKELAGALKLRPDDRSASVNLAACEVLLGDNSSALNRMQTIITQRGDFTSENVYAVAGIAAFKTKNNTLAGDYFRKAAGKSSAKNMTYNLALFTHKTSAHTSNFTESMSSYYAEPQKNIENADNIQVGGLRAEEIDCRSKENIFSEAGISLKGSTNLKTFGKLCVEAGNETHKILYTLPGYSGKQLNGKGIGDRLESDFLRKADMISGGQEGRLYAFNGGTLLVETDTRGRITGWVLISKF